jgi:hypothetical protein
MLSASFADYFLLTDPLLTDLLVDEDELRETVVPREPDED